MDSMAYKSGNPALNKNTFKDLTASVDAAPMTLEGTALKSLLLLIVCAGSGAFGWRMVSDRPDLVGPLLLGSLIGGFIIALITIFRKTAAPFTAPMYALLEGFLLGVISQLDESSFNGIVLQAILLTGGIFISMLLLYLFRGKQRGLSSNRERFCGLLLA